MEKLQATITRVMACRPNPGKRWWHFIATAEHGAASGVAGWELAVGAQIEIEGAWEAFRGEKIFKWKTIRPFVPADEKGILYYACHLAKGFGEKTADKIWDALGGGWREMKPGDVSGMTETKISALREAMEMIDRDKEMALAIIWLTKRGVSDLAANKAWNEWKHGTVGKVEANVFILTELERVAFVDVDSGIRVQMKIGDNDPRRIQAGIMHAYKTATGDGSTVATNRELIRQAAKLLDLPYDVVDKELGDLIKDGRIVALDDVWLTIQSEWQSESAIYNWMEVVA